jgi:hypothetical protein
MTKAVCGSIIVPQCRSELKLTVSPSNLRTLMYPAKSPSFKRGFLQNQAMKLTVDGRSS